jgi:predicted TIM-barrel fold metal-dependent hydrolase
MAAIAGRLTAAHVRERYSGPIIDGDGHTLEYIPALDSYIRREGLESETAMRAMTVPAGSERIRRHAAYMSPLTHPAENTYDLATAQFPRLLYSRLDELGIDFAVVFPTRAQQFAVQPNEVVRRATCRGENNYMMDTFGEFSDRMCPVAVIPMFTPEEAIDVIGRGFKAIMIAGYAPRSTSGVSDQLLHESTWLDTFGIDSEYDYDPFWKSCCHHGISPASHTIGMGWGTRRSPTNYVYNQIGHFAATGEALAKSLFLGGVTRRFPALRFAFLEGGVGWATALYADLVNRWYKRNPGALPRYYKRNIDRPLFAKLLSQYAPEWVDLGEPAPGFGSGPGVEDVPEDDFARCAIQQPEDFVDLFATRFYFGCEADDTSTRLAFARDVNPFHAELRPIFSSDIGHWDVPDMRLVLGEAYGLVEEGWLTEGEFHDFTFRNVVRFYRSTNPDFFAGTVVAEAAGQVSDFTD